MDSAKTFELISLIQEYPYLWRKQEKNFMNRETKRKQFQEIADKMNLTDEECKKKLKLLKGKMRDICNKLPKTRSGQPAFDIGEQTVKWPFYSALLFMKDQFIGRDMNGSFQQPASQASTGADLTDDDEIDSPESVSASTPASTSRNGPLKGTQTYQSNARPPIPKKARQTEELLQIEREKLHSLRNILELEGENSKPADEWGAFVQGLDHDLRKVQNPILVMSLKQTIGRVVGDAVLQQFRIDEQQQKQEQQQRVHASLQPHQHVQQPDQQQQQQYAHAPLQLQQQQQQYAHAPLQLQQQQQQSAHALHQHIVQEPGQQQEQPHLQHHE